MEREHSTLSELITDLRHQAKLSHVKVGKAIHRSRWTSQHYEEGRVRPPVGYVAFIARAAHRQSRAPDPQEAAQELLDELNAAIILYYGCDDILRSWEELCELADRWVEEGRSRQKKGRDQSNDEGEPVAGDTQAAGRAPSAATLSAPCWQLRAATPDFVGREAERERLVHALRGTGPSGPRAALACIRGLGGAGKTELAYRAAEELAGDFPDGQLLLGLAGSTPDPLRAEEALAQVVRAFAPQEQLPTRLPELRAHYRTTLHARRVLIVADDARDAAQLRDLLPPAGNALLITTRRRFALEGLGDANLVELGGLQPNEAEQLLLSLCPRIGLDAPELAALCGFLPLALRIAGGRLASDGTLKVERYLVQLRDEQRKLSALEDDDAERNVAAVLGLSFHALEPRARSLLAQLSVFPASFSREAIPSTVSLPDSAEGDREALDLALSQLHRAGLIELDAEGERVWLHDLVRAFAAAQLDDREATHQRHAEAFAYLARRLGELAREQATQLEALAIFDAERSHISAGVSWSLQHAGTEATDAAILSYAVGLSPLSGLRMRSDELVRLHAEGLQAARRRGLIEMELLALNNLGVLASNLGDAAEARRWFEQAQALQQARIDHDGVALALEHNQVRSRIGLGDYCGARAAAEELRQKCVAANNLEGQIKALLLLGLIERRYGPPELALEYDEAALKLARRLGHRRLTFDVLRNLANALIALPEVEAKSPKLYTRAVGCATEALAIAEELGYAVGRAEALTVLGNAATLHGDPEVAVQRHKEALEAAQAAGADRVIATILINLGDAYRVAGEGELAADAYAQGVRLFESLNDAYGLARAYWRYGALILHLHEFSGRPWTLDEAEYTLQLWERAIELELTFNLPTAEEHTETLSTLKNLIAAADEA